MLKHFGEKEMGILLYYISGIFLIKNLFCMYAYFVYMFAYTSCTCLIPKEARRGCWIP